jgi:hypothetical protein
MGYRDFACLQLAEKDVWRRVLKLFGQRIVHLLKTEPVGG